MSRDVILPESDETSEFFVRNPKIFPGMTHLINLTNQFFGNAVQVETGSYAKNAGFYLGNSCREDYLAIYLLASQGMGRAALKILRSLFESAVTLAYIRQNPEKAQRFVDYGKIQLARYVNGCINLSSEEQFSILHPNWEIGSIRREATEVKPEFLRSCCEKCDDQIVAHSWDMSLDAMSIRCGDVWKAFCMRAYTALNPFVHATPHGALVADALDERLRNQREVAQEAFRTASMIMLQVVGELSELLEIPLESTPEEFEQMKALMSPPD